MAKYIDTDLLITHINQRIKERNKSIRQNKQTTKSDIVDAMLVSGRDTYEALLHFIKKNQQEQPEAPKSKFVFPKYLYAKTRDNKTLDVSYAPQSIDAIEYIRNDFVEQEQPKVDLEKELDNWRHNHFHGGRDLIGLAGEYLERGSQLDIARHFYELGLKAGKE